MLIRPLCSLVITLTLVASGGGGDKKDAKKVEAKADEPKADAKADAPKAGRGRARAAKELRMPAPKGRVVAIGGLNGDLAATTAALKAAGAIDDAGNWSGGDLVVVQTGNQLGGGKDEKVVLALLDRLAEAAGKAGGALYRIPNQASLDGNTVELSTEQTRFGENAVQYQTTLAFLNGRINTLSRALKGE